MGASVSAQVILGARVQLTRPEGDGFEARGKAAVVLAMAALEGSADRRRVALLLWPESPEGQARNNLRTLVHRLNERFGAELLAGAESLSVDPEQAQIAMPDIRALLSAMAAGGAQRCELLADAGVDAEPTEAFTEWLKAARQRVRRLQLAELSHALAGALARADTAPAVALARACLLLEPLSEHWHRQLMDTLVRCGDRAAALVAYEDCKNRLRQDLGVMPDLQTRAVHLRILQDQALDESAGLAPDATPVPAPAAATVTVTAGLTPLGGAARYPMVEREAVLAEVKAALAQGKHVALQGEAGVGKTRLLRALADDGVVDVEQVVIRPGARDEPYAAVSQLLQAVQPRRAARIGAAEQGELARLAPLAFPGVQPSQASLSASRLHAALRHWVDRLAEAGVQRLVLDDVHYADKASQAAIGALLAQGDEGKSPALLLAHRGGEIDASLGEALVAAQVRKQARCINLPRLTLPGVQALLVAMHAEQTEAQAARLLQRTGGNPLFVIEMAQHSLDEAAQAVPAASNLDALLRLRLAGCSPAAQQLAAVAAVAAQDFSVELAVVATGQPALALMPAWSELQQRGLFADHGLAHDLVRDAVLGELPQAIGSALHRQVAHHLERLGLKGAQVLRHWLKAQDHDRALPHLLNLLHSTSAAGLSAVHLEVELLGLMEKLSDAALRSNLWASAEIYGTYHEYVPLEVWPRISALVDRVASLRGQDDAVAGWLAFERARVMQCRDRALRAAYRLLTAAAERMSTHGVERARSELVLADIAGHSSGPAGRHARLAHVAVAGLPADGTHLRLLNYVGAMLALAMTPLELIAKASARMREARRGGDPGVIFATRYDVAATMSKSGRWRAASRYYFGGLRPLSAVVDMPGALHDPSGEGRTALSTGRYDIALQRFEGFTSTALFDQRALFLGIVALRLGQWARARTFLSEVDVVLLRENDFSLRLYALARSELDHIEGRSPLPAFHEAIAGMKELGTVGLGLDLISWELARRSRPAAECVLTGTALIEEVKASDSAARFYLPSLTLEVAEAHAGVGDAQARTLAMEAARSLRRGCFAHPLYLPDGLVRCARLLEATDPAEAAALTHVARRWVLQALPHVPADAHASFAAIPVNRILLEGS